jgi:hypothetical protein
MSAAIDETAIDQVLRDAVDSGGAPHQDFERALYASL